MSDQEKQERGSSQKSEFPDSVIMEPDEGVDAEVDDDIQEAVVESRGLGTHQHSQDLSHSGSKDLSGESPRKRKESAERRRRHRHHHSNTGSSSSHHRRRRSGGHSGEDGEAADEGGRSRKRSDSAGGDEQYSTNSSGRSSHRKSRDRRSSRSQRSRHRPDSGTDDWLQEDFAGGQASTLSKKKEKEKKVEAEAEDGEILEDGELDDDGGNDENMPQDESRVSLDTSHEDAEGSPSKSYGKDEGKSQKREKKKTDHRDKRKKDEDKKKRKKYVDMDKMSDDESGSASVPAWGSGYQGVRQKSSPQRGPSHSPSYGKSSKSSRSKGHQSPPGLYDSPSYSEESDEEQYPRCLDMLSGGYLDASVAADEKEGIFKRGVGFKKKKRMDRNQSGKRRMQEFNKGDGPPKKKALVDLAMSDRPKCKFYRDGKCAKGSGCPFNHDMEQPKRLEVCKYHLTIKGCHKERCLYMHEDFPCKYFHTGAQCFSGDHCKFSHDPLTDDTRRALEMRVAPEDIIDVDDPDYDTDYDYHSRNYESRSRPSLLGSPPRRHEVKKIPSLFDIEVHPPTPSSKPSPSSVRPTGFYNEAESSPPSSGSNAGNSQGAAPNNNNNGNSNNNNNNSSNNGMNNANNNMGNKSGSNGGPNNQGGPGMLRPNMNNNNTMSGPGLLQTPSIPPGSGPIGSMMGGPNRPPLMGNQAIRPGMPFMNNGNNNAPSSNLPPVLNMLGAIIREAAMQKVSSASQNMNMNGPGINNMGGMNMVPNNMNNMPPHGIVQNNNNMNNLGPNNMQPMNGNNMNMNNMPQGNMTAMGNMGPNNMNRMMQGMNQMGPNNMNQMGPSRMNAMGGMNMNQMMPNNMNSNIPQGKPNEDSAMMSGDMRPPNCNRDGQEAEDMMDVDYRIKQNFDDQDESSKDLSELDSLRRRLQEQINQEDADQEGEEEEEESGENQGAEQSTSQGEQLVEDKSGLSPDRDDVSSDSLTKQPSKPTSDNSIDNIEVPAHLPKKQRELFMRIQQQHLIRERERERQEAQKMAEESEKVEKDDWYSSSDDDDEDKPKISESKEDPLKPCLEAEPSSVESSSNSKAPTTAASSTYNIMQMINAIRNQVSLPSSADSQKSNVAGQTASPSNTSDSKRIGHTVETKSPASPPASPDDQMSGVPSFPPPPLGVEPPVVSAMPTKPLKYAIVRIALNMPKTYTFLPSDLEDLPSYRFDPRVKRHLLLVDKQPQSLPPPPKGKEVRRSSAESTEKSAKLVDPRLKRAPTDPRLTKSGGNSPGSDGRPMDPRLKKDSAPSRPVDPRLAKRAANPTNDPRLNRQMSQESGNQMMGSQMNSQSGPLGGNNSMGNMNNMGGPMTNMGGPMGSMGGPINNMGGPMNTMGMNNMGGPMNNMGNPINNMGGPMNNMGSPINNMGGPMNNMGGPMNNMGGIMNNQMGGAINNMNGPVRSMAPINRMGGPMGNPISSMGMPMNSMGVSMNSMGNNRMSSPLGNNSQGNNMMGQRGPSFLGGPMNMMGGPRGPSNLIPNQMGGSNDRVQGNFPENPSDPRLNQRSLSDPRLNDPRLQNKPQEMQDQGMSRNDPRLTGGSHVSKASKVGDRGNDPRLSSDPRRSSEMNRKGIDETSGVRAYSERRSPNTSDISQERDNSMTKMPRDVIAPLPSLSSSASLPPLPSLSPPSSLSSLIPSSSSLTNSQLSQKESMSETQKPSKKFDYRNDPRFKRVKRTSAGRQSSMEYSSPLGSEGDGQSTQDPSGSLQYNSYNRPEPALSSSPHRPNAPSPSLPDTLQDFDMPEFPPLSVSEPDLKVKDLFKSIDPTASPFC